jgi:glutamine cyclotransferase
MKHKSARKPVRRARKRPYLWIGVLSAAALLFVFVRDRREPPVAAESAGTAAGTSSTSSGPVRYGYRVVHSYPHDPQAFTQGLVFRNGFLFESTGLNGRSSVRKVRLETGEVVQQRAVDSQHFAEGLADWRDSLVQLTWRSGIGFVYDMTTFEPRRTFPYAGEGWGLARDTNRLIMSDGTATLRFLDPETLGETGRLLVTEDGRPLADLNELEVVRGSILANIWQTDDVAMIDPASGKVTGRIGLAGLLSPQERLGVDVLNGIAYDAANDRLFVTGKLYPRLFEIKLEPRR